LKTGPVVVLLGPRTYRLPGRFCRLFLCADVSFESRGNRRDVLEIEVVGPVTVPTEEWTDESETLFA